MSVSVAMAVYNGEKYLEQQVLSIVEQLGKEDELVISYNDSTDGTFQILNDLSSGFPCIRVIRCERKGVLSNFENAIRHCSHEIIFLSDQDDIWLKGKVEAVVEIMNRENAVLAMHDCVYTNDQLKETDMTLFRDRNVQTGFIRNWIRNGYQGSCMAFRKELCDVVLPFPEDVAMHDQWIGLLAEKCGKVVMINQVFMKYRRHEDVSSTDHVPYVQKAVWMKNMLVDYQRVLHQKKEEISELRLKWK